MSLVAEEHCVNSSCLLPGLWDVCNRSLRRACAARNIPAVVNPSATLEDETRSYRWLSGRLRSRHSSASLNRKGTLVILKSATFGDVLMPPPRRGSPRGAASRDYLLCHHKTPPVPAPAPARPPHTSRQTFYNLYLPISRRLALLASPRHYPAAISEAV